ncbi:IQ motif [Trypanosoma melophagium]|uniref:IQ motif n=1 Tax=Trypanosoma melophagium TaxID=715481 RepID=UPI003519EECF|nr:IQ motif [Trypanosoma melophagium]
MELDTIKSQITELQGYYDDDTKSDDDIIYAVYNWVKSAHVVAQLLLLEGRFPELRRCFDLCRYVLQEQHVIGNGRRVIQHASGEDRLLMDSLLVRTAQLERKYEETRTNSKGRDTEYYLNKLLRTDDENERDGKESGQSVVVVATPPPPPPERGVSFGRRTRLNRWKVPPVLPALVTQTQLFIRPNADGFTDVMGDSHVETSSTSVVSSEDLRAQTYPPLTHDITMGGRFGTPTIAILSTSSRPSSPADADVDGKVEGGEDDPSGSLSSVSTFSSPMSGLKSPAAKRVVTSSSTATRTGEKEEEEHLPPIKVAASANRKVCSKSDRLVRALSVRVDSVAMPSGSISHRLLMDADAHVIKSAIAIKSANEIRSQSIAFMQSLKDRASSLVQRTRSQRSTPPGTEIRVEETEKEEKSELKIESHLRAPVSYASSSSLNTIGQSVSSLTRFHQSVSSPLYIARETNPPRLTAGTVMRYSETRNINSIDTEKTNGLLELREKKSDVVSNICKLDEMVIIPGLSPQAKEELEEVLLQYQQEKKELDVSSKAMHLKVMEQSAFFKAQEVNVKLEDTSVWKRRRKLHATLNDRTTTSGASASELRLNSPTKVLDSDSVSNSACVVVTTPATASTVSLKGGTDVLVSNDRSTLTLERIAKLGDLKPTEWNSYELSTASHSHDKSHHPTGGNESTRQNLNPNKSVRSDRNDTLTAGTSATITTSSLMKGTDISLDPVEKRVLVLEAASHISFPDVHHMVLERAKVRVEQQRRLTHTEGILSMTSEKAFPSFFSNRRHNVEFSTPVKADLPPIKKVWASLHRLRRESTYKLPLSAEDTDFMREEEEEVTNTPAKPVQQPHFFNSVEELRQYVSLDKIDIVTLSMCLPLHLATVRIQRMCKLFIAKRERKRRAIAVQDHLKLLEKKEESAVMIQRYVRRLLARRRKLTIELRLSYLNDQRVVHEMYSEETITGDLLVCERQNSVGAPWRSSGSGVALQSPIPSFRRSPDVQRPLSANTQGQRSVFSPFLSSTSRPLYSLPQRVNGAPSTRFVRLRRIQENIACRVIVNAFRAYRQRILSKWEHETRACMSFVTQKMTSDEAFGYLIEDEVSFPSISVDRTAIIREKVTVERNSYEMRLSTVYPLPRDRLTGDVVAAWEARKAKTRRAGDFMTPLEPVRLSELRRILCERQEAAASLRRRQQELLLEEEEELRRQQRVRMEAVLLLQRCSRGYGARSRLFVHLKGVQGLLETQHRRKELLGENTSGVTNLRSVNNTSGRNLLHITSAKGKAFVSEDHPIPPHIADVIERGIRLRHSMLFRADEKSQHAGLRAIVMVQSFLRWHMSLGVVADHQNDLCVTLIQRRWRLVLKHREMLRKKKQRHMVDALHKYGS